MPRIKAADDRAETAARGGGPCRLDRSLRIQTWMALVLRRQGHPAKARMRQRRARIVGPKLAHSSLHWFYPLHPRYPPSNSPDGTIDSFLSFTPPPCHSE